MSANAARKPASDSAPPGASAGDLVDLRCACCAEDQSDAVEQKSCGKGAEEKVFDGGFRAATGLLAVPGEDVGGDRGDFESDEHEEQFHGAGEQAHADCAKDNERVELALMVAVFGKRIDTRVARSREQCRR